MLHIIGAAVGSGGPDARAAQGPDVIRQACLEKNIPAEWLATFREPPKIYPNKLTMLSHLFAALATIVKNQVQENNPFCVIGGDHSAAIGTWSGASEALDKPLGLIWIDAHEDAHTVDTTPSGNVHGMPVAALLGHGVKKLTQILSRKTKIQPENICLIGIRSFEPEEDALLKQLGVKVMDMNTVNQRGFDSVFQEALKHITRNTDAYGITLDVDGLDPNDAPGVSTPEPGGIAAEALLTALTALYKSKTIQKPIGFEIMEFNPSQDQDHKTKDLIINILNIIATGA